jgi:hypothetical protein
MTAPPASRTARKILVGGGAVVLILAVIFGIVALFSGSGGGKNASAQTPAPRTTVITVSKTRSVAPSATNHGAAATVIERYFADINRRDVADAQKLICTEQVNGFKQKITAAGGDFTLKISKFVYGGQQAGPSVGSINVVYTVTVQGNDTPNRVTFSMINQNGPKICGEQYG